MTVIPESSHSFFQIVGRAAQVVADLQPDILHTHRIKENMAGAMLKRKGIVPHLVQTVHGMGEIYGGRDALKSRVYGWLSRFVTPRYFDEIFAVSRDIEERLADVYPAVPIRVLHNAIRLPQQPPDDLRQTIRADLGIPADHLLLGTAGRMVPVKGYDILLDALADLFEKRSGMSAIVVGDGPLLDELKRRAESLGLCGRVSFPGFRHDIQNVVAAMDLFVMSSRHEGIPTVLLEAMALNVPDVVTAVGGIPEVVVDGETALLVPPEDAAALSAACLRLLDDDRLRQRLTEQARSHVLEHFTAMVQANRLMTAYAELLEKR